MNSFIYHGGQKKSLLVLDSKLLSEAMRGFHAGSNRVDRHGIVGNHFKRVNGTNTHATGHYAITHKVSYL